MDKNGKEYTRMDKNGQEWTNIEPKIDYFDIENFGFTCFHTP